MELLSAYLPQDRRRAIHEGRRLPDRATGAALFADVSGFTPLTEGLARSLGPRRGAEELMIHLNRVYDALIGEVDRHNGSVIAFAGDAITCWFDGDAGGGATAAALAMQQAMRPFHSVPLADGSHVALAVKTSIATGAARRFMVGDPSIQRVDVLAGQTLTRMAEGGQLAQRGEVLIDEITASALGDTLEIQEWRHHPQSHERFAVAKAWHGALPDDPPPPLPVLADEAVRPWLIPSVYERIVTGRGEFLTELRPATPIFIKFSGIEYDSNPGAGAQLDEFVAWVQGVMHRYEGFLVDINVGDKGSSLYCAFGAPIAHEDDPRRALAAAQQLRAAPDHLPFLRTLQIGLSRGTMRTGAYGGTTRRTYGILGDEVNLAARLMEKARVGQVLVSGRVQTAGGSDYSWESLPPMPLKGKSETAPVFALTGTAATGGTRHDTATYTLPMVGRTQELQRVRDALAAALSGQPQIVGISGEAGMGKSRLLAEALRLVHTQGVTTHFGQCEPYGGRTSYQAWWSVWETFFQLDPEASAVDRINHLAARLRDLDPTLVDRLPLLGPALNMPIPDNDITRHFDAKLRKTSLEGLLVECVRKRALSFPVVVVLEDCHGLDPLSRDLLQAVARAIAHLPVFLLLCYRPPDVQSPPVLPPEGLPSFTEIHLGDLPSADAREFIHNKVRQLFGHGAEASPQLVDRLVSRSEGNPFYLEELINLLKDERIDPANEQVTEALDLPASLHSLVLSRIDRLVESQRITLKVASVIGRLFPAAALWGIPAHLEEGQVRADLAVLQRLALTTLEDPGPETTYIFKHILTQQVAYESLAFGTRAQLHEHIGLYLERRSDDTNRPLDLLAFHFDRSHNEAKKQFYLRRAGEAAQARYANETAIDYFQRLLPLLPPEGKPPILLKLGRVRELVGRSTEARQAYDTALQIATAIPDLPHQARAHLALGELTRKQGAYPDALAHLDTARRLFTTAGDQAGIAETLQLAGTLAAQQGDYAAATRNYEDSLARWRTLDDRNRVSSIINNLGIIAWYRGDLSQARACYEQALAVRRDVGDRWLIANSLNNLSLVLRDQGQVGEARALLEQCIAINRQLGDKWSITNTLSSLGDVALSQGDLEAARRFLLEALALSRELGDRPGLAFLLEFLGQLAAAHQRPQQAFRLVGAATRIREDLGAPLPPVESARLEAALARSCPNVTPEHRRQLMDEGRTLDPDQAADLAVQSSISPSA